MADNDHGICLACNVCAATVCARVANVDLGRARNSWPIQS